MNKEQMNQMFQLNEKAKAMDRLGNEDKALEIYLEILEKYHPHLLANFERPAIILEKKKRYEEAIEICEKAIQLIEEEKISGDKERCLDRLRRLKSKLSPEQISIPKRKKAINYKALISVVLFVGVVGFLIVDSQNSNYEDLYIDTSEMERTSELEGSMFTGESEPEDLPEVTAEMVEMAVKSIINDSAVENANIGIDSDTLGFAIFVKEGTEKGKCESLGNEFVKSLSTAASLKNLELSPPTPISYGELYDYYDTIISVGVNSDNIIAKGTMLKKSSKIHWRE